MAELQPPDESDYLADFRIAVDFTVSARDLAEARTLVEQTLAGPSADGTPVGLSTYQETLDDRYWGISGWKAAPPRPSQAALVQQRYPGLVSDLAIVEALEEVIRVGDRSVVPRDLIPQDNLDRVDSFLNELNPLVRADDPDRSGRLIYEGNARDAGKHLTEGVYLAYDEEDREYALVVAPSQLQSIGRVSAVIPRDRHDARTLDEISAMLQEHMQWTTPARLIRDISRRVETTRRPGFPSWQPLDDVQEATTVHGRAHVGLVTLPDPDDPETVALVHSDADRVARSLALRLHDHLEDNSALLGVESFLSTATAPDDWYTAADVDGWLHEVRSAVPSLEFSIQPVDNGASHTGVASDSIVTRQVDPAKANQDREPSYVNVGVIVWTDLEDQEPTVFVEAHPVALSERIATSIHDALVGAPDLFQGAGEFLDQHPYSPHGLKPAEVDAWLNALSEATPYPMYSIQRLPIGTVPSRSAVEQEAPQVVAAPVSDDPLFTYQVPVTFDVSASTESEARVLVDDALQGDDTGMPGVVQRDQQVRADGDVYGVLGWHSATQPCESVNPVEEVLRQRATDIDPAPDPGTDDSTQLRGTHQHGLT